jgi:hypothetical protein
VRIWNRKNHSVVDKVLVQTMKQIGERAIMVR